MQVSKNLINVQFVLPSTGGPRIGGMEMVAADLLSKLNPQRYKPGLVCFNEDNAVLDRINRSVVNIKVFDKKKEGVDLSLIPKLAYYFRKSRTDIVHTFNEGALVYGFPASKIAGVPVIIHAEHGRLPIFERPSLRAVRIHMIRAANRVVVVSEALRDLLLFKESVSQNKISLVINGVDTNRFDISIDKSSIRKSFGLSDNDLIIGTLGSLTPQKNQSLLIRAVAKVPNIKLLIAGAGPLMEDLQFLIKTLKIENRVKLIGQTDDIASFLGILDMFVLSSITEATSLALLEAMAAKLPVIATDVGGNSAVIGDTGLLVPSENEKAMIEKLIWCTENREECIEFGKKARNRVEQYYSLSNTVKAYEKIFENELEKASCRPWYRFTA